MILSLSICSSLDPQLQDALKEYLVSKGIGESLTNFLLLHLHKKEQVQYVNWLQKLESSVTKGKWQPVAGLTHTSVFFLINTQYILLYEDFPSYILRSLDSTAITSGILSCFFFSLVKVWIIMLVTLIREFEMISRLKVRAIGLQLPV